MSTHWIIQNPASQHACGALLSEDGTHVQNLVTCSGCLAAVVREICNAVEPVPGPLPARCSRPPHDDGDHDWIPGAEVTHQAQLAGNALATATAAAIAATRKTAPAGAGDRLPARGVIERWPA